MPLLTIGDMLSTCASFVRLSSEAARSARVSGTSWEMHFFDYKAAKRAIKEICHQGVATDMKGHKFNLVLVSELSKVSRFYAEKALELESILSSRDLTQSSEELNQLRVEVQVKIAGHRAHVKDSECLLLNMVDVSETSYLFSACWYLSGAHQVCGP